MFTLNLLSPAEKQKVKSIRNFYLIRRITFPFISLILISTTILFFGQLLLNNYQKNIDEQIDKELSFILVGQTSSSEETIKNFNNQLSRISNIQSNYIKWTDFLIEFTSTIPPGISLNSIDFKTLNDNESNKTFQLTGVSSDRSALINFENNLEKSEYFSQITTPISALIQKENINFQTSGLILPKIND